MPAERVRRLIAEPLPTGRRRWLLQRRYRARLRVAAQAGRALGLLERLPGLGGRVTCPLCGWQGGWFRPQVAGGRIRSGMLCPRCHAAARHRLFWLAWRAVGRAGDGPCLHMAPEAWLTPLVARDVAAVVTMDIAAGDVDLHADAERLPFRTGCFDIIISNDVLEHVEDDRRALREVGRVLSPTGVAFLHTPVVASETVEYGYANVMDHGHRRAYGPDLIDRVRDAGLHVTLFRVVGLDARERRRRGLQRPDAVLVVRRAEPARA